MPIKAKSISHVSQSVSQRVCVSVCVSASHEAGLYLLSPGYIGWPNVHTYVHTCVQPLLPDFFDVKSWVQNAWRQALNFELTIATLVTLDVVQVTASLLTLTKDLKQQRCSYECSWNYGGGREGGRVGGREEKRRESMQRLAVILPTQLGPTMSYVKFLLIYGCRHIQSFYHICGNSAVATLLVEGVARYSGIWQRTY